MPTVENQRDINQMKAAASRATAALRLLANEDRLLILCQLTQGEHNVGEIEAALDIHQPTLSQQLGVLRNEGAVQTRRDGKSIYYALATSEVETLLATLYSLYCSDQSKTGLGA
jgi:ArsR family transcriptional regulator